VIVQALSAVYGAAATWRRRWYAASPARTRHLQHPVISIGNLRVGGTGKTPAAAYMARLLVERGERPVILSRGYARQQPSAGVTVVSDRTRVLADVAHAGDEPLLLARALPGVPVLVCADRYAAGQFAESQLDATVHLLDDGFQHVKLARDIDLLLADEGDLDDRVLPAGRLREPLSNASVAHALIVPGGSAGAAQQVASRLGIPAAFWTVRELGALRMLREADPLPAPTDGLFAVAGIERPERFFDDLRAAGHRVLGTRVFGDHHVFTATDLATIVDAARAAGAAAVVTTEKDAVRLEPLTPPGLPIAAAALHTRIEPAEAFTTWLLARLAQARGAH
jgi:tetraacyldisaccharide 4'-kinase